MTPSTSSSKNPIDRNTNTAAVGVLRRPRFKESGPNRPQFRAPAGLQGLR